MAKFFFYPFAVSGDIGTPVPDASQPNGSVSYFAGFGSNYQLPLAGGGAALPINRVQFNSMMNDITGAIQNIQEQGVFSWIGPSPSSDYVGNFPYPVNALVYYIDGNIYQSLIANNQDIPGATLNWLNLSTNSGIPIGSIIDFAGIVVPSNCLLCDGTAYSRTTYAKLFTAITNSQPGNTYSSTTVDTLTSTANLKVGFFVSGPGVQAGNTIASITNSTTLVLSLATTTTVVANPLVFSPWGIGDGSTTFNTPNLARSTTIGSGGTVPAGGVVGNVVGNQGGSETHTLSVPELPPHTHTYIVPHSGGTGGSPNGATSTTTDTTGATGSGAAHTIMQPSTVVLKCIKFQ